MIVLTTDRLIIRDHRPTDLEAYHALVSNPAVMCRHSTPTRDLEHSRVRLWEAIEQNNLAARKLYFFGIEERLTARYMGSIGYTVDTVTPPGKLAAVGYFIDIPDRGKGYISEALRAVVRFAFEEDDVCRFEAGCLKENAASRRVLEKCGFIQEAEFKAYQWHEGLLKDRVQYRLLRAEWLEGTRPPSD